MSLKGELFSKIDVQTRDLTSLQMHQRSNVHFEYLQDETTLRLANVTEKCREGPIRNMKITKIEIQAAVYGVRPKRQIINERDGTIGPCQNRKPNNVHWRTPGVCVLNCAHMATRRRR